MKAEIEKGAYDAPIVEVIEVEVEKGFAHSSGNLEDFIEGEESDW